MKTKLILSVALLGGAMTAQAQTPGQVGLPKYTSTGLQYSWVTPPGAARVVGLDASGNLTLTSGAGSDWADITNKPSTFTPSAHNQAISTITGLQTALDGKAAIVEPSFESAITITDINDPANNGSELNGIIIRSNRENIAEFQQQIIFGNGDKTGRIVAPALVGDYVWYLPQATGRIMLDSDNTGGIAASRLTSGTLPNARLSSIPNSALANSSITINGTAVSLGGSTTVAGGITSVTGTANQITVTGTTTPVLSLPATITGLTSVTSTTFVGALTGTASGNATLGANTFTGAQTLSSGRVIIQGTSTAASPALTFSNINRAGFYSPDTGGTVYYGGSNLGIQFGLIPNGNFRIGYSGSIGICSGAADTTPDAYLGRLAANSWAQYNSTSSQKFNVANTYTSLTNNELGVMDWQTTTNTLRIGSSKGSGGGSNRAVHFIMGDAVEMRFDTDGNVVLPLLPTTAPATSGALWRDAANGNVLKVVP